MTTALKVTPEKLLSTATEFNSQANVVKNCTNKMLSTVKALNGTVWSGEASTAYTKKFNGLQDDMERIYKMISEHVKDLQAIAKEYQTAEKTSAEKASALLDKVVE